MKAFKFLFFLPFFALMVSCHKECDKPSGPCGDVPPAQDGIICQAFFERWFYNAQTGTCEQIGYSGCEAVGFETQAECQSCQGR